MNKNYKILTAIVLIGLLVGLGAYKMMQSSGSSSGTTGSITNSENSAASVQSFILADYPIDQVPLYEMSSISSMHYYVNDDASSEYLYDGPVNYYNVVFNTTAPRSEVFNFYQSMMDSVDGEETTETKLVGTIGKYRVYISQYAEDDDQVYIQAALPTAEFEKTNPYFSDYPAEVVDIDPAWVEKESSYGLRNQLGGQIAYNRYFILDESQLADEAKTDPFRYYFDQYSDLYQGKTEFTINTEDPEQMELNWLDGQYEVKLIFAADHGRVYLTIIKPME